MKYILKISIVLLLCLTLAACQEKTNLPAVSVPQSDASTTVSPDTAPSEPSSGEPAEVKEARLEAYRLTLQQIAFEHTYPDGTDTGFDSAYGSMEDNRFALYDADGDGVEELIVRFITAPMAGNTETIYKYREADGTLKPILTAAPNLTYYANGVIKENWSHGSELAGEGYWPYTLYEYNEPEESFQQIAQVNMWSKAMSTVDFKGDPYPDDIDAEGAGTVFIMTHQGMVDTISQTDYEQWLDHTVGSAAELDIPYQALSEENIDALK